MPQPITKPLIASSNFLKFRYEIVASSYYHASLCFMTTVEKGITILLSNPEKRLIFLNVLLVVIRKYPLPDYCLAPPGCLMNENPKG